MRTNTAAPQHLFADGGRRCKAKPAAQFPYSTRTVTVQYPYSSRCENIQFPHIIVYKGRATPPPFSLHMYDVRELCVFITGTVRVLYGNCTGTVRKLSKGREVVRTCRAHSTGNVRRIPAHHHCAGLVQRWTPRAASPAVYFHLAQGPNEVPPPPQPRQRKVRRDSFIVYPHMQVCTVFCYREAHAFGR